MQVKANLRILTFSMLAVAAAIGAVYQAAQARPTARVPKTVEIKMTNENQMFRYDPKDVTIAVGDTVKWVAVAGSHNIKFWVDSLPAGGAAALRGLMKDTTETLTTSRMPTPGTTYSIVFTGVPKGVYKYYCGPHLMRGMVASITVQ